MNYLDKTGLARLWLKITNKIDSVKVPEGGTTGQVLVKKSNTDNDTEWADNTGGIAGDTLPIGTVVDYDGDTVPENWEEVEESPKTNIITMYNSQANTQEINVTATYTEYPVEFGSYNRIGDKFSVSNNKIVIGKGVTKVLVSGMLSLNRGKNSTMVYMVIKKNSENIAYVATDFTDWSQVAMTTNEALIDVQEGDTISMFFATGYETGTYQIRKGLSMTRITVKAVA